jgi:hypothetical protein
MRLASVGRRRGIALQFFAVAHTIGPRDGLGSGGVGQGVDIVVYVGGKEDLVWTVVANKFPCLSG